MGLTCCSYCSGVRRGKRIRGLTCVATISIIVHYFDLQKYDFFPIWQKNVLWRAVGTQKGMGHTANPRLRYACLGLMGLSLSEARRWVEYKNSD